MMIHFMDSSRAFIVEHILFDHRSFGHDIETAYLLIDAAKVLYGEADPLTLQVAKKLVDHTIAHGFDGDFYGVYDKGYRFLENEEMEILNAQKTWWAQAEAWHSLALMAEIYPHEAVYKDGFLKMWDYMKKELIDAEYGGWYNNGLDESPDDKLLRKAHQWKGAYHNGRALMQVMNYAENKGK